MGGRQHDASANHDELLLFDTIPKLSQRADPEWYKKSNHLLIASFSCSGQRRTITGLEKHLQWYMRYNYLINIIYRLGVEPRLAFFFDRSPGRRLDDTKTLVFLMKNEHFNYTESQQQKPFDDSRLSPQLARIKERRRQSSRQSKSFLGVVTFPSFIFVENDEDEVSAFNSCPKKSKPNCCGEPERKITDGDKNMLLTP